MSVMTVTGPVEREALGIILPHEHLFIDLTSQGPAPADPEAALRYREPISLSNYGRLRRNPYALEDNLVMDDLATAVAEALAFKEQGGSTIVDCTPLGIKRSPELLRDLALETGLNIVAGCGYYTQDTHPADMDDRSVERLAEEMVRDLAEGIDGSGIRAGVIGEIGTGSPIHPNEKKAVLAGGLAHLATGAPLQIHTYPWGHTGLEVLDLLEGEGVDPSRVVICHTDVVLDLPYMRKLLQRGAWVQYDNFGKEFYIDRRDRSGYSGGVFAADLERVHTIRQLIEDGFGSRLLITNDLCLKQMLHRYGGWGYDHIIYHIAPMMQDEGIADADIDALLRTNPAEWLDIPSSRD